MQLSTTVYKYIHFPQMTRNLLPPSNDSGNAPSSFKSPNNLHSIYQEEAEESLTTGSFQTISTNSSDEFLISDKRKDSHSRSAIEICICSPHSSRESNSTKLNNDRSNSGAMPNDDHNLTDDGWVEEDNCNVSSNMALETSLYPDQPSRSASQIVVQKRYQSRGAQLKRVNAGHAYSHSTPSKPGNESSTNNCTSQFLFDETTDNGHLYTESNAKSTNICKHRKHSSKGHCKGTCEKKRSRPSSSSVTTVFTTADKAINRQPEAISRNQKFEESSNQKMNSVKYNSNQSTQGKDSMNPNLTEKDKTKSHLKLRKSNHYLFKGGKTQEAEDALNSNDISTLDRNTTSLGFAFAGDIVSGSQKVKIVKDRKQKGIKKIDFFDEIKKDTNDKNTKTKKRFKILKRTEGKKCLSNIDDFEEEGFFNNDKQLPFQKKTITAQLSEQSTPKKIKNLDDKPFSSSCMCVLDDICGYWDKTLDSHTKDSTDIITKPTSKKNNSRKKKHLTETTTNNGNNNVLLTVANTKNTTTTATNTDPNQAVTSNMQSLSKNQNDKNQLPEPSTTKLTTTNFDEPISLSSLKESQDIADLELPNSATVIDLFGEYLYTSNINTNVLKPKDADICREAERSSSKSSFSSEFSRKSSSGLELHNSVDKCFFNPDHSINEQTDSLSVLSENPEDILEDLIKIKKQAEATENEHNWNKKGILPAILELTQKTNDDNGSSSFLIGDPRLEEYGDAQSINSKQNFDAIIDNNELSYANKLFLNTMFTTEESMAAPEIDDNFIVSLLMDKKIMNDDGDEIPLSQILELFNTNTNTSNKHNSCVQKDSNEEKLYHELDTEKDSSNVSFNNDKHKDRGLENIQKSNKEAIFLNFANNFQKDRDTTNSELKPTSKIVKTFPSPSVPTTTSNVQLDLHAADSNLEYMNMRVELKCMLIELFSDLRTELYEYIEHFAHQPMQDSNGKSVNTLYVGTAKTLETAADKQELSKIKTYIRKNQRQFKSLKNEVSTLQEIFEKQKADVLDSQSFTRKKAAFCDNKQDSSALDSQKTSNSSSDSFHSTLSIANTTFLPGSIELEKTKPLEISSANSFTLADALGKPTSLNSVTQTLTLNENADENNELVKSTTLGKLKTDITYLQKSYEYQKLMIAQAKNDAEILKMDLTAESTRIQTKLSNHPNQPTFIRRLYEVEIEHEKLNQEIANFEDRLMYRVSTINLVQQQIKETENNNNYNNNKGLDNFKPEFDIISGPIIEMKKRRSYFLLQMSKISAHVDEIEHSLEQEKSRNSLEILTLQSPSATQDGNNVETNDAFIFKELEELEPIPADMDFKNDYGSNEEKQEGNKIAFEPKEVTKGTLEMTFAQTIDLIQNGSVELSAIELKKQGLNILEHKKTGEVPDAPSYDLKQTSRNQKNNNNNNGTVSELMKALAEVMPTSAEFEKERCVSMTSLKDRQKGFDNLKNGSLFKKQEQKKQQSRKFTSLEKINNNSKSPSLLVGLSGGPQNKVSKFSTFLFPGSGKLQPSKSIFEDDEFFVPDSSSKNSPNNDVD